jgi:hypothetical protein
MKAEPVDAHQWLRRLIGDWIVETGVPAQPGEPAQTLTGTETVRAVGEIWVVAEGHGPMPDGRDGHTLMTLGYDPGTQRFVGSWIGSMMTDFWVYDGELDADRTTLTLNATGPDFESPGRMRQYQDIIELEDDDHRVLRSRMLEDDGGWRDLMAARYTRKRS